MQDYRRNGWYAVGGTLMAAGTAWLVAWGVAVGTARKDSGTHFWVPATIGAFVALALGLLVVIAVMFDWPSKLRGRKGRETAQTELAATGAEVPTVQPPQSVTLRNFNIGEQSRFRLRSSADRLAEGGGLSGQADLDVQHFPGHPEAFGYIGSDGEQEGPPPAQAGPPAESTEEDGPVG